jgi:hypothetical protein
MPTKNTQSGSPRYARPGAEGPGRPRIYGKPMAKRTAGRALPDAPLRYVIVIGRGAQTIRITLAYIPEAERHGRYYKWQIGISGKGWIARDQSVCSSRWDNVQGATAWAERQLKRAGISGC